MEKEKGTQGSQDYNIASESKTTSDFHSSTKIPAEISPEIKIEAEKYGIAKPKRKVLRAQLTND